MVATAMLVAASPVRASPWSPPSAVTLQPAPAEPTTVDAALEAGDLTTAQALATEAREAEPTAANWQREGEVLEQSGRYADAADAFRGALEAAGEDQAAVEAAEDGLVRVNASARGTVLDEPDSTHREQLDPRWEPPKPEPKPEPTPEPPPPEPEAPRIITKWYFWLTIGAIVASAAAVTTIAIRAARDEQPDALDSLNRSPSSRGMGVLRF